ncbi:hypothetical protein BX600DRAFT_118259 [Xylariales sp. PMI_506]|nr:hypothetical protein BX600DRAFT_118259 [Xylariales sp. PMI_506]
MVVEALSVGGLRTLMKVQGLSYWGDRGILISHHLLFPPGSSLVAPCTATEPGASPSQIGGEERETALRDSGRSHTGTISLGSQHCQPCKPMIEVIWSVFVRRLALSKIKNQDWPSLIPSLLVLDHHFRANSPLFPLPTFLRICAQGFASTPGIKDTKLHK